MGDFYCTVCDAALSVPCPRPGHGTRWLGDDADLVSLLSTKDARIAELEAALAKETARADAAEEKGAQRCIEALRELQTAFWHTKEWNFSGGVKFAPVELSDYLVKKVARPLREGS